MWFRLASAEWETGKHLGAMDVLADAWSVGYNVSGGITKTSGSGSVSKGGTLTATFTLSTGAEFTSATLTPSSAGTVTHTISSSTVTVTIANVSANCTLAVVATGDSTGGGGGNEGDTPVDTEIGTTTTFGSTNVEVTIIGAFSDFNFANKCVVSTSGGSSCSLNTAGASGRISSPNQVLKVSGGETVTFNSSISGLQYALIEFTDKPCTLSTLNKSGQYGQAWTTEASMTLHSNTKYLAINFNNGSADMTSEQLESLKTAIVLS